MPEPLQATGQVVVPAPDIPAGEDLYNAIMVGIEPELVTNFLPLLPEIYKNETTQEAELRRARYERAFEEYDRQYAAYAERIGKEVHEYRRTALQSFEAQDRADESNALAALEATFSTGK